MANDYLGFKVYSGRMGSSNVYVNEELGVIIDASSSMPKSVNKTICLTHNHDDHICEKNFINNKVYIAESGKLGLVNPSEKNNILYDELGLTAGLWGSKAISEIYGTYNYFKSLFIKKIEFADSPPAGLEKIFIGGHSPDSTMYLMEENGKKALFDGDLIYVDNTNVSIKTTDGVVSQSVKGLLKVLEINPDYLLPGHGEAIEGRDKIKELAKNVIAAAEAEKKAVIKMMTAENGVSLKEIIQKRGYKTNTFDCGQAFPLAIIKEEIKNNPDNYYIKNKRVYCKKCA